MAEQRRGTQPISQRLVRGLSHSFGRHGFGFRQQRCEQLAVSQDYATTTNDVLRGATRPRNSNNNNPANFCTK